MSDFKYHPSRSPQPRPTWGSPAMHLRYVSGDITNPAPWGSKIIVNLCNTNGDWSGTLANAISKKWSKVKRSFKKWHKNHKKSKSTIPFVLGEVQFVDVTKSGWIFNRNPVPSFWVANLLGIAGVQEKYRRPFKPGAIRNGLIRIANFAEDQDASVHMTKLGCSSAEDWRLIENIIENEILSKRIAVSIYGIKG